MNRILLTTSFAAIVLASCGSITTAPAPPSTVCSSIAGVWSQHRFETTTTGEGAWAHATETIRADCTSIQSDFLDSTGNTTPPRPITYTLDANSGTLMSDNPSFKAMIMRNSQMIVATRTAGGGSTFRLIIWLKESGTFTLADLVGTHQIHLLRTGTGALWSHGMETIDGAGNATSLWTSSDGSTTAGVPSTRAISSDGIIIDDYNATWYGKMAPTRDLVVATAHAGSSYDLILCSKAASGTTFTQSDLAGIWRWHFLLTGTGHNAWVRGTLRSDSGGNVTILDQEDCFGTTALGSPFTWSINADGIIARPLDGTPDHGVMLSDKRTIISAKTTGDGSGYRLMIGWKD